MSGPLTATIGELTAAQLRHGGNLPLGVARTTGGKWDPTSGNLAFLAGGIQDAVISQNPYTLIALNELTGPKQLALLDRWCDERQVLLDSGVFALAAAHARNHDLSMAESFGTPPAQMDGWDELYSRYCSVVSRFGDRLWGAIELDQGGTEWKPQTRAQITRDTGVVPIPVYHPLGDGWDYYDTIAATHDRICVGGLAGRIPSSVRQRLCWTATERARKYPHLWTHLLGVTPSPLVLSFGLRGSTDSSAWLGPVRWPQSWRAWASLQRVSDMPLGMVYRRDLADDPDRGHIKARKQAAASATFQQHTLAAVAEDTHPHLEVPS